MGNPENRRTSDAADAVLAAIAVGSAALVAIAYWLAFRGQSLGGPEAWGWFGDYFTGLVGPAIGLVTVFLVVRTLKVTREEASETRSKLEAQLAQMQHDSRSADLHRRLEGALREWDTHTAKRSEGQVGFKLSGGSENFSGSPAELFSRSDLVAVMARAFADGRAAELAAPWDTRFLEIQNLLSEIAEYCAAYDAHAGNHDLTDFYRRRVNLGLRALACIGRVSDDVIRTLSIGRKLGDIGKFTPNPRVNAVMNAQGERGPHEGTPPG